ncbi:MAG: peptide MFS transporter [Pseudomonadota bacterium]
MSETTSAPSERQILGHPRGLATLFFTEMWERFSYYGMRALLVLFMTDQVVTGGLGFTDKTATAIYGLYTAAVYLVALPGGWIADRLMGAQKAVWYGGIIIMAGHFVLAIPNLQAFFLGLVLVVLGTGLLKPNISAIVGELYTAEDPRRDAGFTIFYMGINVGAALGPIICGGLGQSDSFGWHYGFAAAGIGMLFGLIQYKLSGGLLGEAGTHISSTGDAARDAERKRKGWIGVWTAVAVIAAVVGLALFGVITIDAVSLAKGMTYVICSVAAIYFIYVLAFAGLDTVEKKRVVVIIVLFLAAAMFWSGFEQAGSSLNLFAERYTDRIVGSFEIPASWFQSLNAVFIILLAPLYASAWVWLAKRNMEPSTPFKFALGLIVLAMGFLTMVAAATIVAAGDKAMPTWLILTYLLHTMGELTLSPVGLSATTKLAPRRFVGQMMGIWFLATSLGNLIAGLIAGEFDAENVAAMPDQYWQIVLTTGGAGLLLLLFTKPVRKLMGGIH